MRKKWSQICHFHMKIVVLKSVIFLPYKVPILITVIDSTRYGILTTDYGKKLGGGEGGREGRGRYFWSDCGPEQYQKNVRPEKKSITNQILASHGHVRNIG